MAREFNGSNAFLSFTLSTAQRALTQHTFSWIEYLDSNAQYRRPYHFDTGGNDWRMEFDDAWGYVFTIGWSANAGKWSIPKPSTGGWHVITITYDGSSTANDPVIYLNGASQTVTERATPSGTIQLPSGLSWIGAENGSGQYFDGRIAEFAMWDSILSAGEITNLGALYSPTWYPTDLVFHIPGLSGFTEDVEGITVTNTNTTDVAHPDVIYPGGETTIITPQRTMLGVGT